MNINNILNIKSKLYKKYRTIENKFKGLSNYILNHSILKINGIDFRICEIEYYYNNDDHPDPYVHGDIMQKENGTWYFHRQNGKSYKGGEGSSGARGQHHCDWTGRMPVGARTIWCSSGAKQGERVNYMCRKPGKMFSEVGIHAGETSHDQNISCCWVG